MGRWAVPGEQRTCEMGAQVTGEERDRKGPKYQISRHGLTVTCNPEHPKGPDCPSHASTVWGRVALPYGAAGPFAPGAVFPSVGPVLSAMPGAEQGSERPGE